MSDIPFFKVTPETSITGEVVEIEEREGQYGQNYNVTLDTGNGCFVVSEKKEKWDDQFARKGLSFETIIGKQIKVWKKPMKDDPTKGFLNIDVYQGGAIPPRTAAPAKPTPAPAAKPQPEGAVLKAISAEAKLNAAREAYLETLLWAMDNVVPILTEREINVTAESLNATVATIMIQAQRS